MKSALPLCPGYGQPLQPYLDALADWQSGGARGTLIVFSRRTW
jgi:hypothetical protein